MVRGEIWWADLPRPAGRHPVLLLSRDRAIEIRQFVTVAQVSSTIRDIPVEVKLGPKDGMPKACVANLDVINTIPKTLLSHRVCALSPHKMEEAEEALKFALGMD